MIEVATVDDFARRGIGAGNGAGHDGPVAGADFGFDVSVESDLFSSAQAGAECFGGLAGDHESEARGLAGFEMSPANQGWVEAGPRGGLVRHVADDPTAPC